MAPFAAWLAIAAGGACGAVARFALAHVVQSAFGPAFPWGTTVVNVVGSFAFGLLFVWIGELGVFGADGTIARFALLVGFLGAFTTFSTFAFETAQLVTDGRIGVALLNVLVQNVLAVLAVFGGSMLGRAF